MRLLLDPEGEMGSTGVLGDPGYKDFLLIAAGRGGLWIMDADPAGGGTAARVDDSIKNDPGIQNSKRYCNDLTAFKLEGDWFVAATFAKRNHSQLRIYKLQDVRKVLNNNLTMETGNEILPKVNVPIGENPHSGPQLLTQINRSYAMSVDSRVVEATPGSPGPSEWVEF